jgi:hypothetical protein
MNFVGKNDEAFLYFGEQKMFLNGELFRITINKVMSNEKFCRFTFGESYYAKVFNNLLTLYMGSTIKTLLLKGQTTVSGSIVKYLVSPGKYLLLDKDDDTCFIVDNTRIDVISKELEGAYVVYKTKSGDLYISSDESRASRWKNCSIFISS